MSVPIPPAASTRRSNRAFYSVRAWMLLLVVLGVGLALDLGSKWWCFDSGAIIPGWKLPHRQIMLKDPDAGPPPHRGKHLFPWSTLDLRLVVNRGAVFGIAPNQRFFFIIFTIGALAAGMLIFGRFTTRDSRLAHVAVGLILAGGLGNLYDRIFCGVVRDFLHMLPGWHLPFGWRYPEFLGGGDEIFPWVFNIADVMLLTGMCFLMLHINRMEKRRRIAEEAAKTASGLDTGPAEIRRPA